MAEKIKLSNVDEKFFNVRNVLPGMSEDLYHLTDYIGSVANSTLVPSGLVVCILTVMDDIEKGKKGIFGDGEFPKVLIERKKEVLEQILYIPQVVDVIADEEFALEFRQVFDEIFEVKSNLHVDAKEEEEYPENVSAAIEWWANAIQAPRYTSEVPSFVSMFVMKGRPQRTEEEIKLFKSTLAENIIKELEVIGRCNISVDYRPCQVLALAGEKIGLDDTLDYPFKTTMEINKNEVIVYSQSGKSVLWTSEQKELKLK